mgnify:CR=1 FL=1
MIPIGDDNRDRRRPGRVTMLLILANIAVFIHELRLLNRDDLQLLTFFYRWGAIPYELTRLDDLPPEIGLPVVVTAFTAMFLHGGWLHLLGNMLYLWVFGDNVEDTLGHLRYLLFYLACGLGATVAQILLEPASRVPLIGASGAISGVLAAYLLLYPLRRVTVLVIILRFHVPAWLVIGMWIGLQFFNTYAMFASTSQTGAEDNTAYMSHIGGFVAGIALILLLGGRQRLLRRTVR